LALTETLGVNPHSYMVNELAKAIQRDSLAFQMKKNTEDQLGKLFEMISEAQTSQDD
jgi:Asp-tRNA(Asn)/Glu-tRNA(Gln) amidotransferase B subunit